MPGRTIRPDRNVNPGKGTKGGRPRIQLSAIDLTTIENAARCGCTLEQIGHILGISEGKMSQFKSDDAVCEAIKRAKADGIQQVGAALFNKAVSGDVTAMIWFEKTRARRSDRVTVIDESEASKVLQNLSQLSTDQLARIANGESPADAVGINA